MDISISEAKAKLSEYVEKARQGQEITLHKNNVPVCKLVKIEAYHEQAIRIASR